MVLLFLLLPQDLKGKTPYFHVISLYSLPPPNGSNAHVNLCPPQPHLSLLLTVFQSVFKLPNNRPDCSVKHPTHSPKTNIHAHDKDTFSSQSLLMQHQGFVSTKDSGFPVQGGLSKAGRTCSTLWEWEGCRLGSLSCKPTNPESSTEHKPCA